MLIQTGFGNLYSTAVSPYNGDIMIGGNGVVAHYSSTGYYLDSYTGHTGPVNSIFWTNDWLISIDDNGNVVKHDPVFLNFIASANINPNMINIDISQ